MNYANPLTNAEANATLEAASAFSFKAYVFVSFAMNSNLRVSDILSLKIRDIFNSKLEVKDTIKLLEKKTSKKRLIYVNSFMKEIFVQYLAQNRDLGGKDYIFYSEHRKYKKGESSWTRQYVDLMLKKLSKMGVDGVPTVISAHSLRKTFARRLYDATGDIVIVSKLLNHSSPAVTMNYLFSVSQFKEAYDLVKIK